MFRCAEGSPSCRSSSSSSLLGERPGPPAPAGAAIIVLAVFSLVGRPEDRTHGRGPCSGQRSWAKATRGAASGPLSAELVQNGTLKTYAGFPHGMPTTEAETINADLLAFVRS